MRIGELAEQTGVSVRSLRYYEQRGLVRSTRSATGYRVFADSEVQRVLYIRDLLDGGLSTRVIGQLVLCVDSPGEGSYATTLVSLMRERERLGACVDKLLKACDSLDEMIAMNSDHRGASVEGVVGEPAVSRRPPRTGRSTRSRTGS